VQESRIRRSTGNWILLIHGFGDSPSVFDILFTCRELDQSSLLCPHCFTDLPTLDCKPAPPFLVEANSLKEIMDAEQLDQYIVLAHSLGASIAVELAKIDKRVKGLVLVEPPWITGTLGLLEFFAKNTFSSSVQCVGNLFSPEALLQFPTSHLHQVSYWRNLSSMRVQQAQLFAHEMLSSFSSISAVSNFVEQLSRLNIPSIVLFGSRRASPILVRQLKTAGADVQILEDCGHWPMYDAPSLFCSVVSKALFQLKRSNA
jgi:pimeloyl-ACP methyl ester carboxylesterase